MGAVLPTRVLPQIQASGQSAASLEAFFSLLRTYNLSYLRFAAGGRSPRQVMQDFFEGRFVPGQVSHDPAKNTRRVPFSAAVCDQLRAAFEQFAESDGGNQLDDTLTLDYRSFQLAVIQRIAQIRDASDKI